MATFQERQDELDRRLFALDGTEPDAKQQLDRIVREGIELEREIAEAN